jgi:hypothetical protein
MQAPISERALIARINRKLARDGQQLRVNTSNAWRQDLGNYYVLDGNINSVVSTHEDLEPLARELGCLKPHERLAQ